MDGLERSPAWGVIGILIGLIVYFTIFRKKKNIHLFFYVFFCYYIARVFTFTFLPLPLTEMGKEIYRRLSGDIINIIPFIDLITNFDFLTLQQYILNIIMFVPFGFLVPLTFKQYFDIKKISIISFAFSLFIELSQLAISCLWIGAGFRICDVNDLICNTLGGIFGYMILKGCLWILEGGKQKYEN